MSQTTADKEGRQISLLKGQYKSSSSSIHMYIFKNDNLSHENDHFTQNLCPPSVAFSYIVYQASRLLWAGLWLRLHGTEKNCKRSRDAETHGKDFNVPPTFIKELQVGRSCRPTNLSPLDGCGRSGL